MIAACPLLLNFVTPLTPPFSSSFSTAGKLFFNYFPYASQWTRVSLLCSSNRCCHMPQTMSNSSNAFPLGKFHFIFELFMLQWKFLAGNASKEWQGGGGGNGGDYQNKRAIWQIVDLPHSKCRAENQLITLSLSLPPMFPIKNSKRQSELVFRTPSTLICCWTLIFCYRYFGYNIISYTLLRYSDRYIWHILMET